MQYDSSYIRSTFRPRPTPFCIRFNVDFTRLHCAPSVLMQKFVDENKLKINVTSKQFIVISERNLIHDHSIATFVENVNHRRSKTLRLSACSLVDQCSLTVL